ncbi:hypothetical protein [Longispora urticae]
MVDGGLNDGYLKGFGDGYARAVVEQKGFSPDVEKLQAKADAKAEAKLEKTLTRYRYALLGACAMGFGAFLGLVLMGLASSPTVQVALLFTGMLFMGAGIAIGAFLFRDRLTHGNESRAGESGSSNPD